MLTSIYIMAFIGGIVSFLSPCIIPMITVYFSLITGMTVEELKKVGKSKIVRRKIVINTFLFIASFTIVFTAAGAASGKIAGLIKENITIFNTLGGIMVIILAFKLFGFFKALSLQIKVLDRFIQKFKMNASTSYITIFLVGLIFAIACSHCIGPLLYSILIFAGNTGSTYTGMLVMFMFSMGLAVPYLLTGLAFSKALGILEKFQKYHKLIAYMTGTILLLFGILLLLGKFTIVVETLYRLIPFTTPIGM